MDTRALKQGMKVKVKSRAEYADRYGYSAICGLKGIIERFPNDGFARIRIFRPDGSGSLTRSTWAVHPDDFELLDVSNQDFLQGFTSDKEGGL